MAKKKPMKKAKAKSKAKTMKPVKAAKKVARPKARPKAVKAARPKVSRPAPKVMAPKTPKGLAPGYQWVNTYLTVRDVAAAIRFYETTFGFKLRFSMPGPGGVIVHAEMTHYDSCIMMGPENPQMGANAPQGPSPVTMYVYVENVDATASSAVANGGRMISPPEDKFWGDRCAIVLDIDGHSWMLATHVKDVSPEDMHPPAMEPPPPTM